MKLALITDTSAYLPEAIENHEDVYVLDIPIIIDGKTYIEGQNLTLDQYYDKLAASKEVSLA